MKSNWGGGPPPNFKCLNRRNSDADRSISVVFGTYLDHVTPDVYYKRSRSRANVKVTAWKRRVTTKLSLSFRKSWSPNLIATLEYWSGAVKQQFAYMHSIKLAQNSPERLARSDAGSGMAAAKPAIPIWNFKFWELIFRQIIKIVATNFRFKGLNAPKSISAGTPLQTPLRKLTALLRPSSWI